MIRLRTGIALGVLVSMTGCVGSGRQVAYTPYRPIRPGIYGNAPGGVAAAAPTPPAPSTTPTTTTASRPRFGLFDRSARPASSPAPAARAESRAGAPARPAGHVVEPAGDGLSRFFPNLPRPSRVAAELLASRRPSGGRSWLPGRSNREESFAAVQAAPLPVALAAEVHPDSPADLARRNVAVAAAPAVRRPSPLDIAARLVRGESAYGDEPAAEPEVVAVSTTDDESRPGSIPVEVADESKSDDNDPSADEPEETGEPGAAVDAPPPIAEPDESSPASSPAAGRSEPPAKPDADPVLAGRPRLPLVRPSHLPADLPPPEYPRSYGLNAAPQPAKQPQPEPQTRRRPRLLERLRSIGR